MRKFAANYLISESGIFLKNSIIIAEEDGTVLEFIDSKGDLREIAQLIFFNGILIPGCTFVKTSDAIPDSEPDHPVRSFVFQSLAGLSQVSIHNLIESGKQVQEQFPEMKIPEIMNEITEILLSNGGYSKEKIPGIFLLKEVNLPELQFTQRSRLKKII